MDAVWITLTFVVACVGGWPLTAGVLKLAKSQPVRAAEARERGQNTQDDATRGTLVGPASSDNGAAENLVVDHASARLRLDSTIDSTVGQVTDQESVPPESGELDPLQPRPLENKPVGVLRGGLFIGVLERGAVVLAILTGQPVAVAYVVAIKGLGRYPELKSAPEASERFIIGTLTSMLWAAGVAALAKVLLL